MECVLRFRWNTLPEFRGEITEEMDEHIQNQVDKGLYPSKAEYLRERIRQDMDYFGLLGDEE